VFVWTTHGPAIPRTLPRSIGTPSQPALMWSKECVSLPSPTGTCSRVCQAVERPISSDASDDTSLSPNGHGSCTCCLSLPSTASSATSCRRLRATCSGRLWRTARFLKRRSQSLGLRWIALARLLRESFSGGARLADEHRMGQSYSSFFARPPSERPSAWNWKSPSSMSCCSMRPTSTAARRERGCWVEASPSSKRHSSALSWLLMTKRRPRRRSSLS